MKCLGGIVVLEQNSLQPFSCYARLFAEGSQITFTTECD